jgi:hypothetical protein
LAGVCAGRSGCSCGADYAQYIVGEILGVLPEGL